MYNSSGRDGGVDDALVENVDNGWSCLRSAACTSACANNKGETDWPEMGFQRFQKHRFPVI
jgi:hypothetical protein